ncbi:MAG: hypothetical protein JO305_02805 [Alphaproteobacteria bacterium]|nr:hypothetical protein [Alphaproteobacteria bacterium]
MSAVALADSVASGSFREHLLPTSFAERGASVPFTTPLLAHARVRQGWRGRFELVILSFAGGAGHYVVPWQIAPDLVPMTAHDRLLHQEVLSRAAINPQGVREAALAVAETGLAGPDVAEAAQRAMAAENEAKLLDKSSLMVQVIAAVDETKAAALTPVISQPEGPPRIREAFFSLGERVSLDPEAFDRRLSELSQFSYLVGTAENPAPGRLRRLLAQLDEFQTSIAAWGAQHLGTAAEHAAYCANAAGRTLLVGGAALGDFEAALDSPREVVAEWGTRARAVARAAARLAWVVDGWETITIAWFAADSESTQIDALAQIVPAVPILPRDEAKLDEESGAAGPIEGRRRGWVRTSQDWRTGEPDSEIVQRLEAIKAKLT